MPPADLVDPAASPPPRASPPRAFPPRGGPVPAWVGRLLEPVYRAAVTRRNRRFDRAEGVERFGLPIISVGNLSVGGTGKTPMVTHIVRGLLERGRRPAIVMRGYKRAPQTARGAGGLSDEQAEYADTFAGRVPVRADPDRCRSIAALERERACDVVVMDDGFQHRRVRRDLDIVLLDATRDAFADHLLPRGWLREPVRSLERAGVIVLTRADAAPPEARGSMRRAAEAVAPGAAWCEAEHAWSIVELHGAHPGPSSPASDQNRRGATHLEDPDRLAGRALVLACGIGNPGAFERQAVGAGARLVERVIRPDHHHWSGADVRTLRGAARRSGAEGVLTTMKDWVKLREVAGAEEIRWWVPRVEMRISEGAAALEAALSAALQADAGRASAGPA